jgi:hypothetical protein
MLQCHLQIKLTLSRIFVNLEYIRQLYVFKFPPASNYKGVLKYRDCNVLVGISRVFLLNFYRADNLDFVGLQFYDLVPAVNANHLIIDRTFKDEEVSNLAHALKRCVARSFEQQLTLFVPNLNQKRAIVKFLQFRISDLEDYRTVEIKLVGAARQSDCVELVQRHLVAHHFEHLLR